MAPQSQDVDDLLLTQAEALARRRAADPALPSALRGPKRALLTDEIRAQAARYVAAGAGSA